LWVQEEKHLISKKDAKLFDVVNDNSINYEDISSPRIVLIFRYIFGIPGDGDSSCPSSAKEWQAYSQSGILSVYSTMKVDCAPGNLTPKSGTLSMDLAMKVDCAPGNLTPQSSTLSVDETMKVDCALGNLTPQSGTLSVDLSLNVDRAPVNLTPSLTPCLWI
jgi:hypothetical protein